VIILGSHLGCPAGGVEQKIAEQEGDSAVINTIAAHPFTWNTLLQRGKPPEMQKTHQSRLQPQPPRRAPDLKETRKEYLRGKWLEATHEPGGSGQSVFQAISASYLTDTREGLPHLEDSLCQVKTIKTAVRRIELARSQVRRENSEKFGRG